MHTVKSHHTLAISQLVKAIILAHYHFTISDLVRNTEDFCLGYYCLTGCSWPGATSAFWSCAHFNGNYCKVCH